MKKLASVTLFLIALLLFTGSCGFLGNLVRGSGTLASEERQVQGIRAVDLTTEGDLTIELGDQEALRIEAEDNLLPYLETKVQGGTLMIGTRMNTELFPTQPIRYTLVVPSLEALSVSSSGNIDAPALAAAQFKIEASSSGDVHLAGLTADRLEVRISSSGNVAIDGGEVGEQTITVSSSGEYTAPDLLSQSADIRVTSSGHATVWVTGRLDANLSSSGNANYYGDPQVNIQTSSSGNAVSMGDK
jgi:hypothetical protein